MVEIRPQQCFEEFVIRNITVESGGATLISINKWTQYFDLQGQPEPESVVRNITLSAIKGSLGSLGVIDGNERTELGEIKLQNVDVNASSTKLDVGGKIANLSVNNVVVNGKPVSLH